jgi:AcrR family transcriptional regulator
MARPRSDLRERMIATARAEFLEHGVDAGSLRAIAKRARTTIGMVYYYFPTKDVLFLAVVDESYDAMLARLAVAIEPTRSFAERVERLYGFFGALSPDERDVLRMIVREALCSTERLQSLLARFERGHLPMVIDLVRAGFAEGQLQPGLHPLLAMACLGGIGLLPQLVLPALTARLPLMAGLGSLGSQPELATKLTSIYLQAVGAKPSTGGAS